MDFRKIRKRFRRTKKRIVRKINSCINIIRDRYGDNPIIYAGYILIVSIMCMLLVQLLPDSRLRQWYREVTHKDTINKGIEDVNGSDIQMGEFMTFYRFSVFGASNPSEIDPDAPMVAFTFDDGPSSEYTGRILDALSANYSHATFFVVGRQTEQFPEVLQAILASGCEIGNHTFDHKNLTELNEEQVEQQIGDVDRSVERATGEGPMLIRPPYGAYDDTVMGLLDRPVILWDIDSEDWESRNARTICDKVLSEVKDGDIILMHDIYESSAEAVEILVPKLKEQGYQIVSVSEMAKYRGKTLELGKAYGKFAE